MSSANQAKEIYRRLSNFWCLSENRPVQLFGGILAVSAAILAFSHCCDIHTLSATWADM
jgi:hypothetical protein